MRGQISINITWIFAAIAGITVFLLIMGFTQDITQRNEVEQSATTLQYLDNQLSTAANTNRRFQSIQTNEVNIEYQCRNRQTSRLSIEGASATKDKSYQVLYTPGQLQGSTFYTWTRDWTLVNRIDRFLYLSDPDTVFVIVQDSEEMWREYFDKLPDDLTKAVIPKSNVTAYGGPQYDKFRYVFFNQSNIDYSQGEFIATADISAVNIKPGRGDAGGIQFYQMGETRLEPVDTLNYVGEAMLYGGIFSENIQQYRCNRAKAYTRLRQRADLEVQRIQQIIDELESRHSDDACINPPDTDIPDLSDPYYPSQCNECLNMLVNLKHKYESIRDDLNANYDLAQTINEIKSLQNSMEKGRNCPTL